MTGNEVAPSVTGFCQEYYLLDKDYVYTVHIHAYIFFNLMLKCKYIHTYMAYRGKSRSYS